MNNTKAFITGSTALESATADSDVDLVMLVNEHTKALLIEASDLAKLPCRFGKLNLILCTSHEEYSLWLASLNRCQTEQEKASRKLDRDERLAIHVETFKSFGWDNYFNKELFSGGDDA